MLCRNAKEDNKVLKYNHGERSMKVPFIISADWESLLEKLSTCHNNSQKSSTIKIKKQMRSGYSLFTHFSFDLTKKKPVCYKGKACAESFCKDLKEHATQI